MCSSEPLFQTRIGDLVRIHPSSVNHDINFENGSFQVYLQKVRTKKVYIRECSLISHLSLLMFGGGSIEVTEILDDVLIGIDDKIKFKTDHETASSLKSLRHELEQLLSDKITEPDLDLISSPWSSAIITCIVNLITDNVKQ